MLPQLHLVALPHMQVRRESCGCAYTSKVLKFCKMMGARGWKVILYAPEGPEVEGAAELVPLLSDAERVEHFGADDENRLPDWPEGVGLELFNRRAIDAIPKRAEPRDLLLLTGGRSQASITDALTGILCCEPGVGYEGVYTNFRAFESYAWMHHVYAQTKEIDGRWFDAVIPNYFDTDDFPLTNSGDGDYLVFLGRLVSRKGPHVAAQIAEAVGMRLVVAGAGATSWGEGKIVAPEVNLTGPVEYVGPVGVRARAELLAGARALIVPTIYIEPFGGVAVEAMMCGTPAITTDWGAFTETVTDGVSGFRFRTLAEGITAVDRCDQLDPETIREYARSRYSLEAVAPQFERWFGRLNQLWGSGWNALPAEADWLVEMAA